MEVEGSTPASAQDASFLKKDALESEKLNNSVDTTTANAGEKVEGIKTSEADCTSTVESTSCNKINDEKDDLLKQIEEVCNDKLSDLDNSEDISKTSEHEFLQKIEEMEKNDRQVTLVTGAKINKVLENIAENVVENEASTIDAVIVGDKVLIVKEDNADEALSASATSSEDLKESPSVTTEKAQISCESTSAVDVLNKDAAVSSSTTKNEINALTIHTSYQKHTPEPKVEQVESTGLYSLTDEKKNVESMDTKSDDIEDIAQEEMDVDNGAGDANSEVMEVDKEPEVDDNVEMVSLNTCNEAKPKIDSIAESSEAADRKHTDVKETTSTTLAKEDQTAKNCSTDIKSVKTVVEELRKNADLTLFNHNEEKKADETPIAEVARLENKPQLDLKLKENIVSSSLTNTPVSSSNVFNSTPIQKQFEISSENVSKISDAAELSHTEKEEATSSKPRSKSFEDSTTESGTCASSETDHPSSDGAVKKYIDAIKKYNGVPDTTTDEEDTTTPAKIQKINENFEINICYLPGTDLKKDSTYEVNVCCEQNDVRYLSIERVGISSNKNKSPADKVSASESSIQSSSNGSVTSFPAYSLPHKVETPTSASTSSSTNCHSLTPLQNKHTILGIEELCNFMINQFTKIKHAVNPESATAATSAANANSTPTQQMKKNKKNSPSLESPSTSASKTKRARKRSLQEDDLENTPKAKQAKRDISKDTSKADDTLDYDESKSGPCVLAKWIDKKFYAGKITAEKAGNKYVVLFEDGASKTLPKESIVFGEGDILPLQDQQVFALVEEDYERGTVLSIENSSSKVLYTVKTENTTVKVTASDIYLEVDQAKQIQKLQNIKLGDGVEDEEAFGTRPSRNKRTPVSPSTPEAGYSGAVGKRGGKRQKRYS